MTEDENEIMYVEDSESLRSLDLGILTVFLTIIPFPLLIICLITVVGLALGSEGWLTLSVYMTISVLSWIAAPGVWKLKKSSFFVVLVGLILAIIASSLDFFEYITTGIWAPGEELIYWFGVIELIVYSVGILILLRNYRKFFTKKVD